MVDERSPSPRAVEYVEERLLSPNCRRKAVWNGLSCILLSEDCRHEKYGHEDKGQRIHLPVPEILLAEKILRQTSDLQKKALLNVRAQSPMCGMARQLMYRTFRC